ncbi:replication-associated recombination protein A [bacterium]|nr:MAG: replication-associated recombination protein A [bacterium]
MDELFQDINKSKILKNTPLAERARPKTIDEVVGQSHLIGENAPLRKFFSAGNFPSIIFWGPPGVGKTTFANLIANAGDFNYTRISAIESGVKEIREIIAKAKINFKAGRKNLLFIDEIHRFNKSQQDALLHAVETGILTLIGATTENPSFEVNGALLSRCSVYKLNFLSDDEVMMLINRVLEEDIVLSELEIEVKDWETLFTLAGGDGRSALNILETAIKFSKKTDDGKIILDTDLFEKSLLRRVAKYDKKGDNHYDTISAFIKSLRGSDPDAALLWMAKMIEAGEDPKFIARRMVIFASEDIGNADTNALRIAISVFEAVNLIGMPEAGINLAQGVTYLASAPKSNATYMAYKESLDFVRNSGELQVPIHLRNAPTKLMKEEGYGRDYKYPHQYGGFIDENYFPINVKKRYFYNPKNSGLEKKIKERLDFLWKKEDKSD